MHILCSSIIVSQNQVDCAQLPAYHLLPNQAVRYFATMDPTHTSSILQSVPYTLAHASTNSPRGTPSARACRVETLLALNECLIIVTASMILRNSTRHVD